MKPFLYKIAEEIASRYGDDPGSICVVLPNRRAGLYLRKYLAEIMQKTTWAPQTFSVEDFITQITGHSIIDPAGLLFELYATHKEMMGDEAQEFDLFADWGQVLLKDFDEIDQYLADPEKVFTFLDEARALTVWNLGERPLTDHEQNYIRFYQSFKTYYFKLKERLLLKNQVYQGLAYRLGAEQIEQVSAELPWKKIFFAGLNALATAEEKIIGHLISQGKAEVFWDADEYYIRDKNQEAGDFIREHLKKWPSDPVKWIEKEFRESEKSIHIFGIPKGTGQSIKAGQIISKLGKTEGPPDKTALVLADESLLLPVLYSLPDESGPVNVTMGFPFRYTNLYQLVYLVFQLHENSGRLSGEKEKPGKFFARDILKVLGHPYLYLWIEQGSGGDDPDRLAEAIRSRNRIFLDREEIGSFSRTCSNEFREFLEKIFNPMQEPGGFLDGLIANMECIRKRMSHRMENKGADHELDFEYLYHLSKVIKRSRKLLLDYPYINSLKSLRKVLFQVLDMSRLPFYGEPLKGLQVMGVLETRAIDFENLVVLSVNEGILPSGRSSNSFIPFDIKQVFGLPTFQQRDAVFAYHFYRMLQRAKNIYLLYDTEGDMMKGGERSRFITQVSYELAKVNSKIHIEDHLLSPNPPATGTSNAISMPKTGRVMQSLREKCAKGFSPSALNLYIRCPLQFYFQEVIGLAEAEEIEETIESKTLGTVIHDVLFKVYQPFVGTFIRPEQILEQAKLTDDYLKAAFHEHYRDGDIQHGKNHLAYKVSLFLINQLIRSEAEALNNEPRPGETLKIEALEVKLESYLECRMGAETLQVRIKGKADRIDRWTDTIRVIDYKTGSVKPEELRVKSWDTISTDPAMAKAFQLLVYAYLYQKQDPSSDGKLQSGNISLRKISEGVMEVNLPENLPLTAESLAIFGEVMTILIEEILDPKVPFDQTEDLDICTYCNFRAICCR